jgi:hypothetical protein
MTGERPSDTPGNSDDALAEDEALLAQLEPTAAKLGPDSVRRVVNRFLRGRELQDLSPRIQNVITRLIAAARGDQGDDAASGGAATGVRPGPREPVAAGGGARRFEEALEPPRDP